jgi:nucleoside-diphosphate-sugar epimerase
VDALVERGAKVRLVDDLTSGRLSNIEHHLKGGHMTFVEADLREPGVTRAAKMELEFAGKKAEIRLRRDMPTGPADRVADNALAKKLLGWEPKTKFRDGLKKTMDWYFESKKTDEVRGVLEKMLTAR